MCTNYEQNPVHCPANTDGLMYFPNRMLYWLGADHIPRLQKTWSKTRNNGGSKNNTKILIENAEPKLKNAKKKHTQKGKLFGFFFGLKFVEFVFACVGCALFSIVWDAVNVFLFMFAFLFRISKLNGKRERFKAK